MAYSSISLSKHRYQKCDTGPVHASSPFFYGIEMLIILMVGWDEQTNKTILYVIVEGGIKLILKQQCPQNESFL